jgi:BNR/Asp-box repeat.
MAKERSTTLLVGTRKGAWTLRTDRERERWKLSEPTFLGHIIYHYVSDPRNPNSILMAAKTGHLGPTVFRSADGGKSWSEAKTPPAFKKLPEGETGRSVELVFWVTPGHESEPNVWYAGTSPPGLFRTEDGGENWEPVKGWNEHPDYEKWLASGGATPGGHLMHSISIDPRDANHMYLGVSVAGVFESNDKGRNWHPLNKGLEADFLPDGGASELGHDPHCIVVHPANPDRLYQQNHCGIYRMDRPTNEWTRIGRAMPKEIGDIGFPIVVHPRNENVAWVFPMDGTDVWPRTSPDGKPALYMTRNAGKSWKRQDEKLPKKNAFFTVKRQAMTADAGRPLGLYFGTTGGDVWASTDEGKSFKCIARYLPEIYSLTVREG